MKAVALIGGEATRLRPLTCNIPKAMVPVLNRPFFEHVILHLRSHGILDMVLTEAQSQKSIESYFADGRRYDVRLSYATETAPLGTAGAFKNAESYIDGTFVALNGDIFTRLDVTAMIDFHREKGADATIALTPVEDPTSYGLVETDSEGRVLRFIEKPAKDRVTTNMINAGTYVLERGVLDMIPPNAKVSIERETFPLLLSQGKRVYAYPSPAYWMDIGTPEKYLQLNRDLLGGKVDGRVATRGVLIGEQSHIHPSARIEGPAVIGPGCSIGEDAVIEDSVIWERVRVGRRVKIMGSVVANGCILETGSTIQGSVLGENVTVSSGKKLEPGSRIEPETRV